MLLELVGLDKVETRLEEIRGDVDDAVEGVRSFAALRKYNATHSVFGTRYYSSQEDYKRDLQVLLLHLLILLCLLHLLLISHLTGAAGEQQEAAGPHHHQHQGRRHRPEQ